MKSIKYICRLSRDSWLPRLRTYGSELDWALGFDLGLLVNMVLVAPVGSPLGYSINMLLGLALCNYFGTREGYLVVIPLVPMSGLMLGTGEGPYFGLSLGITLGSPLESPDSGAELTGMLLDAPLGLWFVSEVVRFRCSCRRITDFFEATFWGVGMSCDPNFGYFITFELIQ